MSFHPPLLSLLVLAGFAWILNAALELVISLAIFWRAEERSRSRTYAMVLSALFVATRIVRYTTPSAWWLDFVSFGIWLLAHWIDGDSVRRGIKRLENSLTSIGERAFRRDVEVTLRIGTQ